MAGSPLTAYLDLQARTTKAIETGPKQIVNDAQVYNNFMYSRFLAGKGEKEMMAGGLQLSDEVLMEDPLSAQTHLPGHSFTWPNPQTAKYWAVSLRYLTGSMSFIDQEIEQQAPATMTAKARFLKIKDMHYGKRQAAMTSLWNKMETLLFAEPVTETMETNSTTASTEPYSIAAFVNEQTNGLFNNISSIPASVGTAWTTVEGLSPTATGNSRWKNAAQSYTSSSTTAAGGVVDALENLIMDIGYMPPPTMQEYFNRPEMDRLFLGASRKGLNHYKSCLRDRQDILPASGHMDAGIPSPTFDNVPMYYLAGLDSATWYPNHLTGASITDNVTEGQTTSNGNRGPRYYALHPRFMGPVFHVNRYFVEKWELKPTDQYEATVIPISVWFQWRASSRRRHGIVYPSGNVFTTAY